jgi:hypothetical protein
VPGRGRPERRAAAWVLALLLWPLGAAAQGLEGVPPDLTWAKVAATPHLRFAAIPRGRARSVLVWGGIGDGDAQRFAQALNAAGAIDDVEFFSPGGLLDEGLSMGYEVRRRSLATRIPAGARCASACNFAFMGGVVRSIDQGARFEVHMFATGEEVTREIRHDVDDPPRSIAAFNDRFPDTQLDPAGVQEYLTQHNVTLAVFLRDQAVSEDIKSIQQNAAATAAKIGQFLLRMQLSLDFLTAFARIPNDFPRPLSPAELRRFNVVND